MPTPRADANLIKEMRRLRAAGMTQDAVSRKLGVSAGLVSKECADISAKRRTVRDEKIEKAIRDGWSRSKIQDVFRVSRHVVRRVVESMTANDGPPVVSAFAPDADEADLPTLPESDAKDIPPFPIDRPGRYLILSDVHLPCHDVTTINCAVREAKTQGVVGVILNGDILDCHELSRHDKDPKARRYVDELKMGQDFLAYLRGWFPKADIFYKLGNHEARLQPYLWNRAPAFEGMDCLSIESAIEMKKYGVTNIDDKRVIHLGKLHVIHGHEYRGGQGGVNPARWLYLKARAVTLCGHFHRTSEHHANNIADKPEAAWSVGCACGRKPAWLPINEWNAGFCIVEIDRDGGFVVQNKRVLGGKVV
jgi:predicted phosphodiesterase